MKYLIKIIQIYHKYLFLHSKDWQTRSKLIEADFERKLDALAVKDKHFMVRQTLASCRIGQKTQSLLAEDESKDVLYTLCWNEVLSPKTYEILLSKGFDNELEKRKQVDIIKYGRFSSIKK